MNVSDLQSGDHVYTGGREWLVTRASRRGATLMARYRKRASDDHDRQILDSLNDVDLVARDGETIFEGFDA